MDASAACKTGREVGMIHPLWCEIHDGGGGRVSRGKRSTIVGMLCASSSQLNTQVGTRKHTVIALLSRRYTYAKVSFPNEDHSHRKTVIVVRLPN